MMANSARDPYWQGAVRRETIDHPESAAAIEDECSKCHMPMARFTAHTGGREGQVLAHVGIGVRGDAADVHADLARAPRLLGNPSDNLNVIHLFLHSVLVI